MNWNNILKMIASALKVARENPSKASVDLLVRHFKNAVMAQSDINVYQELQDEIDKIHNND